MPTKQSEHKPTWLPKNAGMLIIRSRTTHQLSESDVTSYDQFLHRRQFLRLGACTIFTTSVLEGVAHAATSTGQKINSIVPSPYNVTESKTPFDAVAQYNNFYEFSLEKEDVAKRSRDFQTVPGCLKSVAK